MNTEQNDTQEHHSHVWNIDLLKLTVFLGAVSGLISLLFPEYKWLKTFAYLYALIFSLIIAFGFTTLFWSFFKWLSQLFKN